MEAHASYRGPNLVIAARVAMAFITLGLLSASSPALIALGAALIVLVLAMDGLDGFMARRSGRTSELGAVLDITADRIVEHVFWVYFAVAHQVGVWAPLVVMTRSFLVDSVRGLALAHGKTAFGPSTMMRSPTTRFLTSSRFMRTLYGSAKAAAFVLMGTMMALEAFAAEGATALSTVWIDGLAVATRTAVVLAVLLCVARGAPVVWDSRRYLSPSRAPAGTGSAA